MDKINTPGGVTALDRQGQELAAAIADLVIDRLNQEAVDGSARAFSLALALRECLEPRTQPSGATL